MGQEQTTIVGFKGPGNIWINCFWDGKSLTMAGPFKFGSVEMLLFEERIMGQPKFRVMRIFRYSEKDGQDTVRGSGAVEGERGKPTLLWKVRKILG